VVAATLATTNARGLEHATKKRGDEETRNANENANAVFGAVATVGPDAFAATMRDAAKSEKTTVAKTFHLPGGLPGGGELSFSGGREIPEDVSARRLESKSKTRGVRPAFARPKLSEAHEKVSFSRGAGVRMAAARDSAAADARALREAGDAGVAFALSASNGVLPAFGEFRVLVTCVSDAPGEYCDFLSCAVGHLPKRRIPVRAGVQGSPLEVRPTRHAAVGASSALLEGTRRRDSGAKSNQVALDPVIHGPSPAFCLDWGETPVGATSVLSKRFFCVNRGPFDAEVEFTPWLNPIPSDKSAYYAGDEAETTCASVRLVPDEIAGNVEVRVVGRGIMCARRGPFRVKPEGPVIVAKNGGVAEFVVEYFYKGTKPRRFVGSVVSKQRLLSGNDGNDGNEKQASSVRVEMGSAVATATLASRALPGMTKNESDAKRALARPVRVRLAGAFHAHAAPPPTPMKPLVVRLAANAFAPRVVPDAPANFKWRCRASVLNDNAKMHAPEYTKAVTLTNPHAETVAFRVTCPPPFEIVDAEASTPQASLALAGDTPRGTHEAPPSRLRDVRSKHREADSVVGLRRVIWRVPAKQNLHVTLRFALPVEDVDDAGEPVRATDERYRQHFDGALVLLYENGDAQHFSLDAQLLRPTLRASAKSIDFGKVHLAGFERVANLRRVTLFNDSGDEARWVAETRGAFFCAPTSGIVAAGGSGVVEIGMRPSAEDLYEGGVAFRVDEGRGCDVACAGEGTLDEAEDA
jgi:hypothetical protein